MELSKSRLDDLLARLLLVQLRETGMFSIARGSLEDQGKALSPLYARWLAESVRILARHECVTLESEGMFSLPNFGNASEAWQQWEEVKAASLEDANLKGRIRLLDATLHALPQILTGARLATDVLFADASMQGVEGVYQGGSNVDYFNAVIAEGVAAYVEQRLATAHETVLPLRPIRILEVGAGTGATTAVVLARLAPYRETIGEYCFTDLSKAFLIRAEREYGATAPYLTYKVLNIEASFEAQNVEPGYDVVIAANVVHATRDIRRTLRNIKGALHRHGVLMLSEIHMDASDLFTHLTFGLTKGWWLFEDEYLRVQGTPALRPAAWQAALVAEGFADVCFPAEESHRLGQQIIVAESDGVVQQAIKTRSVDATVTSRDESDAMPVPAAAQSEASADDRSLYARVRHALVDQLASSLKMAPSEVQFEVALADYGMDSIVGIAFVKAVNQTLAIDLETTAIFDYSSIAQLTTHIVERYGDALRRHLESSDSALTEGGMPGPALEEERATSEPEPPLRTSAATKCPIAVIGMSGRFAKASDLGELWQHLAAGDDLIEDVRRGSHASARFDPGTAPSYGYGSFLRGVDEFDPLFFNISGAEAVYMDPRQRLFLEESWKALEDAGYAGVALRGRQCGVYVGSEPGDYKYLFGDSPPAQALWGNAASIVPARIAYYLDLQGPAITVDTACSSALVACHLACQGLWMREVDLAIAGGVSLGCTPQAYGGPAEAGMLSPTGRCHTFDARADGFVPGEGVGAIVLKRLDEALADGDIIHGVIRGSGVNQDGATNGITAPSARSQERLERYVYETFGIDVERIEMVEAHGTATVLGDPIEFAALTRAFRRDTTKQQYCAIGSIKSNLGHTMAASGMAGLLKVLLAFRHRQIPPSLHYESPNPRIDLDHSPFFVNTKLREWPNPLDAKGAPLPRCAAVSSFGMSGTNAHMVVESFAAPANAATMPDAPRYLLLLSTKTEDALQRRASDLAAFLCDEDQQQEQHAQANLAAVSHTLACHRQHFAHRCALLVRDRQQAVALLEAAARSDRHELIFTGRVPRDFAEQPTRAKKGEELLRGLNEHRSPLELQDALAGLAQLYCEGYSLAWRGLFGRSRPPRVCLPSYPFARERYWVDGAAQSRKPHIDQGEQGLSESGRDEEPAGAQTVPVAASAQTGQSVRLRLYGTEWVAKPVPRSAGKRLRCRVVCVDSIYKEWVAGLEAEFPEIRWRVIAASNDLPGAAERLLAEVQETLRAKPADPVLIQVVLPGAGGPQAECALALAGLLKSGRQENPKLIGQVMLLPPDAEVAEIGRAIEENASADAQDDGEIRYLNGVREVSVLRELPARPIPAPSLPWKNGGTYLIVGGAGGLGRIFAREILRKAAGARIVLTGRSSLDPERRRELAALEQAHSDARVEYRVLDVANEADVRTCVHDVLECHGALDGVIHAAGVIHDNFIIRKTAAEFRDVMAPKIDGVLHLDSATADLALDCFILFSSGTAVFGNVGQSDYAVANAFLDRYASYRTQLVKEGKRSGRTLSVGWPLWAEGGMHVDAATLAVMRSRGLEELDSAAGIAALYAAWESGRSQIVVLATRSADQLGSSATQEESATAVDRTLLEEKTLLRLRQLLGGIAGLGIERIEAQEPLESYGIDSIMITRLNQALADVFGNLSKTLFYEYPTLSGLCEYLVREHADGCARWSGLAPRAAMGAPSPDVSSPSRLQPASKFDRVASSPARNDAMAAEGIAIIGLSGRYPGARTIDEFWDNLKSARNCIVEIPSERWSLREFFEADVETAIANRKSYSKWGGFIDGFAEFDPLFFQMSPREIFNIDPQERLFLQVSWEVLEDGGYTKDRISAQHRGRVGVFAGITKTGFDLYGPQLWERGAEALPHTSFGSLANRVSYLLDLHGPSLPIDTMCSASLTAIHEACEHLSRRECELAIAGGVNVYLHPSSYIAMCMVRMLSRDGECRSFGRGGNGFVPGEGVGAVLLKPLSRAVEDHDRIYGVIKGSSINHGGKTNGYTVPNPIAQREVILAALAKAQIDPRAISYVEAHGTGTELGDPIEIAGLTQAFAQYTHDKQFCAIGSAKSNIGHLESAAGIAGLTKVLLQMKHAVLVPSLHCEQLNPNIDFMRTPFQVQRELSDWSRPELEIDGVRSEVPRVAGISSFGAGGANAHVIVEEYNAPQEAGRLMPARPALIVLSARTAERLREYANRLWTHLGGDRYIDGDLADVAYTLQLGREAMEHRLAFTATSIEEARSKLRSYIDGQLASGEIEECYVAEVRQNKDAVAVFAADEDLRAAIDAWCEKGKYGKLLELWVKGLVFDWGKLYAESARYCAVRPRHISLPTYPFAADRYWLSSPPQPAAETASRSHHAGRAGALESLLEDVLAQKVEVSVAARRARAVVGS